MQLGDFLKIPCGPGQCLRRVYTPRSLVRSPHREGLGPGKPTSPLPPSFESWVIIFEQILSLGARKIKHD